MSNQTYSSSGRVHVVGAGPGDPELLTLRAARLLGRADAVVYDRLVDPQLLELCPPGCRQIFAGKATGNHMMSQSEINFLLIELARGGLEVVRLKGGDPFVFGRGGEEAQALAEAGVPFEIVPGVTSAVAAPAYAGVPVTHRGLASSVTFITAHEDPWKPDKSVDYAHLAASRGTLVFLMGARSVGLIARELLENDDGDGYPCRHRRKRHHRPPARAVLHAGGSPPLRRARGSLAARRRRGGGGGGPGR